VSSALLAAVTDNVRSSLAALRTFLDPELSFAAKQQFRAHFCREVRDSVLVAHLDQVVATCRQFSSGRSVPPALLLSLSRVCRDLHTSATGQLAALLQDSFPGQPCPDLAPVEESLAGASHALLAGYVAVQAADLSLMLRKSVEARDWLSTVEPRSVRAVMKRVVEDVTEVDGQVGQQCAHM
jgi:hypothetical protein